MFEVEIYGRVSRAVRVESAGGSQGFRLTRETVGKMLQYAAPPGYQRQQPIRRPKLGPWVGVIDAILEDDKQRPAKQRDTAKRICDRLEEEHQFTGGYTIVKDYVRTATLPSREMFVPLTHAPGEAQADFGEAVVVIAGVEQKAHLAMDLPHSDDCFVAAFPAETTEACCAARREHVYAQSLQTVTRATVQRRRSLGCVQTTRSLCGSRIWPSLLAWVCRHCTTISAS